MTGKTLIIGCGYIGHPLAGELLRRGQRVSVWVHTEESARALGPHHFERVITGSVGDAAAWGGVTDIYDLVIHCASSGRGGEEAYEEVYHQGAIRLTEHLQRSRKIFVSSTSVYGQNHAEIVTEESLAEPAPATGKILRLAEEVMLAAAATVVRSSGIYGPKRSMLFEKYLRGEAVIEGDGQRWINQIHQSDLVGALVHLIDAGEPWGIYNATDDTPVTQLEYHMWLSEFLDRPMPPNGPINPNRKRGLTNKQVSNAKLRASGWAPIYPSFREGLSAEHMIG